MMLFWTILLLVVGIALLRLLPIESSVNGSSTSRQRHDSNGRHAEGDPTDG